MKTQQTDWVLSEMSSSLGPAARTSFFYPECFGGTGHPNQARDSKYTGLTEFHVNALLWAALRGPSCCLGEDCRQMGSAGSTTQALRLSGRMDTSTDITNLQE